MNTELLKEYTDKQLVKVQKMLERDIENEHIIESAKEQAIIMRNDIINELVSRYRNKRKKE